MVPRSERSSLSATDCVHPQQVGYPASFRYSRGLTLIELAIAIAIVVLLVVLLSPSLADMRRLAMRSKTLSLLRSHGATFSAYTSDYADSFPYYVDARATCSVVRCRSAGVAVRVAYFEQMWAWPVALGDQYFAGQLGPNVFQPAEAPSLAFTFPVTTFSNFFYPCTFVTRPEYWNAFTRQTAPSQWAATRGADVLFPSKKSLLFANYPWLSDIEERRSAPTCLGAFADGHAADVRPADLEPPHPTGDGPYFDQGAHPSPQPPLLHTEDGLRGRDVR